MKNKHIIIDASKCEWRTGIEHCGDYECMLNKCCDFDCDWYKRRKLEQQLKAKEQECEELNKTITNLENIRDEFSIKLDQLKAENERLQEEREKAKNYNLEYGQLLIKATNKNNKLSKTLTEIKEIAEHSVILDCNECPMEDWCEELCSNENNFQEVILQKISEVEDGN